MKSHELAKLLLSNPDVELICQKDSEGNGFSPLSGVDFDVIYLPDSTYGGECFSAKWTAVEADMDESEWEELKKEHGGKCAMLYPIR